RVLERWVRLGPLDGQSLGSWLSLPAGLDRERNPHSSDLFVVTEVELRDLFSASDEVVLLRADDQEVIGIEEEILEIARGPLQLSRPDQVNAGVPAAERDLANQPQRLERGQSGLASERFGMAGDYFVNVQGLRSPAEH